MNEWEKINQEMILNLTQQLRVMKAIASWSSPEIRNGFTYRMLYMPHRLEKEAQKRDRAELKKSAKIITDNLLKELGIS